MTTRLIRFTPRETPVDDSGREPDGVTHQVRFCEGGGTYPKGDSRCYSPDQKRPVFVEEGLVTAKGTVVLFLTHYQTGPQGGRIKLGNIARTLKL